MPELPEVDRVRSTLLPRIAGRRVVCVEVRRPDVITSHSAQSLALQLLEQSGLVAIHRHGKQLAIVNEAGACVCVHLGMSGSLQHHPAPAAAREAILARGHVHVLWRLDDGSHLSFRDPRRFGGLWTFPSVGVLRQSRWAALGCDALTITPAGLGAVLARTSRPIKAALLDQSLVAGLGNIYVDEALFASGIHPLAPADGLPARSVRTLCSRFKAILRRAIASGGSTIRTYTDGLGDAGTFQKTLRVYGRGGQRCFECGGCLVSQTIAGRTTTFCVSCQAR